MAKYSLKNRFDDEKFEELARISHNLRYYSKIWKEHYGEPNRRQMKYWEDQMDKFLAEIIDYRDLDEIENKNIGSGNWGSPIVSATSQKFRSNGK